MLPLKAAAGFFSSYRPRGPISAIYRNRPFPEILTAIARLNPDEFDFLDRQ
jgi:hypothetical protein